MAASARQGCSPARRRGQQLRGPGRGLRPRRCAARCGRAVRTSSSAIAAALRLPCRSKAAASGSPGASARRSRRIASSASAQPSAASAPLQVEQDAVQPRRDQRLELSPQPRAQGWRRPRARARPPGSARASMPPRIAQQPGARKCAAASLSSSSAPASWAKSARPLRSGEKVCSSRPRCRRGRPARAPPRSELLLGELGRHRLDAGHQAAVDVQTGAADRRGVVRQQKAGRRARPPRARRSGPADTTCAACRAAAGPCAGAAARPGVATVPGSRTLLRIPCRPPSTRGRAREGDQRGLRRAVGRVPEEDAGVDRGDEDQRAALSAPHRRQQRVDDVEGAAQVAVDLLLPARRRGLGQGGRRP